MDPEDAAQDVLATATAKRATLRNPDDLEAWLFGITRRVLAAHRRRVWLRRWVGPVPSYTPDDRAGPDVQVAHAARARQLQHWLEQLPAAQREVVVLRSIEERSGPETARLLGIPLGTVKSRLRLGMRRLRELAGEEP